VLWSTLGVIVFVGAVYFVLVQRHKPAHLEAPEDEALMEAPVAPASP
jgi:hypothetical protein